MSVRDSHQLCDIIEKELEARLSNTSVLIHIEPQSESPRETRTEGPGGAKAGGGEG